MRNRLSFLFGLALTLLGFGLSFGDIANDLIAYALWSIGGLIVIITIILYVLSKIPSSRSPLLPQEEIDPIDIYPANKDDIYWIESEEKQVYHDDDVMPFELINSWYTKNSSCFWIIKSKSGERLGNIYILPIRKKAMAKLIEGTIREKDITSNNIYSREEAEKITTLHICSFVCRKSHMGSFVTCKNLPRIIKSICDPLKLEAIYALSASKEGTNLLHRNGFTEIRKKKDRLDGHVMYSVAFYDLFRNINSRLPESEKEEQDKLLKQLESKLNYTE